MKYIKGGNNVVANALSCLEKSPNQDILNISELYGYNDEDLPDSAYPIRYHDIAKAQETDAKLQQKLYSLDGVAKDDARAVEKHLVCLLYKKWHREYSEMIGFVHLQMSFVVVKSNNLLLKVQ